MTLDASDRLAVLLLAATTAAVAGMLLGSWQLVLYPTLVVVGTLLAFALVRRAGGLVVPVAVTLALVTLFGVLHVMGLADPSGEGLLLGWDPMTGIYLFVVGPVFVLVGLLYVFYGGDPADRPGGTGRRTDPRTDRRTTTEEARR